MGITDTMNPGENKGNRLRKVGGYPMHKRDSLPRSKKQQKLVKS